MKPELVPYPVPTPKLTTLAPFFSRAIKARGISAVVDELNRRMGEDVPDVGLMQRVFCNTCLAFSDAQVQSFLRRQLLEVTKLKPRDSR